MTANADQQDLPRYALGYDPHVLKNFRARSAATHAAHLIPHLRPGMRVLDAGSGQGSISIDLARLVAPGGEVVGFDFEPSQVEDATKAAHEAGVDNLRFEVASVYDLPYPDAHFDVVHMCALLIHLPRVQDGLRELKRVLKPGGILATRDTMFGDTIVVPENAGRRKYFELRSKGIDRAGGNGRFGRYAPQEVHDAGFVDLELVCNFEPAVPRERMAQRLDTLARTCDDGHFANVIIESGIATRAELDEVQAALRAGADEPFCYLAVPHMNVVARKP